jgi:hypothetical protein
MRDEIDPAADSIWESVGSITTRDRTVERQPRTGDEWQALRRDAVILTEAANLLIIPGRQVSKAAFPSDGPGVLSSAEIQRKLDHDRAEFAAVAQALRTTGRKALAAIDAKDPAALLEIGETLDGVCESCHVANWYPHEVIPPLPEHPSPP